LASRLAELLLRGRRFEGERRVGITLRPVRVALLVHPTEPSSSVAAVGAACLLWGGIHQFLVPCAAGGQPSPMWSAILERLARRLETL
jgi:hypothetical protein